MKAKVLVAIIVLSSLSVVAQRGVRIGYIDMEYILENVEEYKEATAQLDKKVQKWKIEIEQQKAQIEQMKKDLNAEKVLLTQELIEEREEEIQQLEKEMLEYQQDRFGPQGDLVQQKRMLVQPIQDQVFNAVQEIAANKNYDFIFDRSADVVMLYSDKRHDISDLVLRRINAVKKQNQRIAKGKSAKDKFEEEVEEIDPDLAARKKAAQEKREAQAKAIEERRQQKLKEREERKKAYEERRKKLLEAREAKKRQQETEKTKDTTTVNNNF